MNDLDTLSCRDSKDFIEITESIFRRIYDLLGTIANNLNCALDNSELSAASTANTSLSFRVQPEILTEQNDKRSIEKELRLRDLLRTSEQLKSLSQSILNEAEAQRNRKDADVRVMQMRLEQFKCLSDRLTMPEREWVGESESRLLDEWRRARVKLFKLCHLYGNPALKDSSVHIPKKLLEIPVATPQGTKKISVVHGNLCDSENPFDVVVCSAFKNDYAPVAHTLIGELLFKKNISVLELARDCELDFRRQGAWLSKEIDSSFHRIACIELLEYSDRKYAELVNIKSAFSTLNYLIEQAAIAGISVKRIALPVIGSGSQNIDAGYIISPLVTYCLKMLRNIDETEEIIFYELDEQKANFIADRLREINDNANQEEVFISYSSKQYDVAIEIYNVLTKNSIKCWMAPQSIPVGSQYYLEISKAINSIKLLLLVLTQDAVNSVFVPKEISASLGAGKKIAPFQVGSVRLENGFDFLLEGEQIKTVGEIGSVDMDGILQEVKRKLL